MPFMHQLKNMSELNMTTEGTFWLIYYCNSLRMTIPQPKKGYSATIKIEMCSILRNWINL